jgi:hypothetical protein
MNKILGISFAIFILLVGALPSISMANKKGIDKEEFRVLSTVKLIKENDEWKTLFEEDAYTVDTNKHGHSVSKEKKIREACKVKKITEPPVEFAWAFLLEPLADWFMNWTGEQIDEQLQEYMSVSGAAAATTEFYKKTGKKAELNYTCFRLRTTVVPKDATDRNNEELILDFIGQFGLSNNKDLIRIQPLKLYYNKAQPKTSNHEIGLAIGIQVDSTWRQDNIGKNMTILNTSLLSKKRDLSDYTAEKENVRYSYFLETDIKNTQPLPLIPWSTDLSEKSGGNAVIKITVAETGKASWLLRKFSKIFKAKKDDITKLLKEAIGKLEQKHPDKEQ